MNNYIKRHLNLSFSTALSLLKNFKNVKYLFIAALLFVANLNDADSKDKHLTVKMEEVKKSAHLNFKKDKELFINAFAQAYSHLKPEEIDANFQNQNDIKIWLGKTFDEEINILKEGNSIYLRVYSDQPFFKKKEMIGLVIVEKVKDIPNSLYIRQFAVRHDMQRKNIGTYMVNYLKTMPKLRGNRSNIYLVTRRKNLGAINFYKKLGFTESVFSHSGYDKNKYIALEWHAKPH